MTGDGVGGGGAVGLHSSVVPYINSHMGTGIVENIYNFFNLQFNLATKKNLLISINLVNMYKEIINLFE